MSKGLGITQRKVLALLQRQTGAVDPFALAGNVYRVRRGKGGVRRLTDAQLVAVRRAPRGLEKTGKVYRVTWFKRTQWANERTGLWMIIRDMQQTSAVIAETGDEAAFRSHSHKMLPLIRRAKELGIDITSDKPPAPTK